MLAYILAIAVGLGSFALYMSAFFFPEVHRKNDLVWSGVGLFYALILWACAGRFTGAVLLGQVASVSLLGWLGWQTLSLRRSLTPVAQQTPIPADLKSKFNFNGFTRRQPTKAAPKTTLKVVSPPEVQNNNVVLPESTVEVVSPSLTENIDNNITPEVISTPTIPDAVDVAEVEETPPSVFPEVEETVEPVEEVVPNAATLETAEPTVVPPSDSTVTEPPTPLQPNFTETVIPVPPVTPASRPSAKPPKPAPTGGKLSGLLGTLTGLFQKKPKPPKVEKTKPVVSVESPAPAPIKDQTPPPERVTPIDAEFDEFDELESVAVASESTVETVETEPEVSTEPTVTEVETVETEPEVSTEPTVAEGVDIVAVTIDNIELEPAEQPTRSPFEEMVSSSVSTVEVVIEMTEDQLSQIADAVEEKLTENLSSVTAELVEVIEEDQAALESESSESDPTTPPSLVRPNPPDPDLKAAAQNSAESPASQPESPKDS